MGATMKGHREYNKKQRTRKTAEDGETTITIIAPGKNRRVTRLQIREEKANIKRRQKTKIPILELIKPALKTRITKGQAHSKRREITQETAASLTKIYIAIKMT